MRVSIGNNKKGTPETAKFDSKHIAACDRNDGLLAVNFIRLIDFQLVVVFCFGNSFEIKRLICGKLLKVSFLNR